MDYDERALADCVCLNGALLLVVGTGDLKSTTANLLTDTIEMDKPYHSIQQFNDLSSTTHKEVLQVLTKAIAIASKQEKAQCRKRPVRPDRYNARSGIDTQAVSSPSP